MENATVIETTEVQSGSKAKKNVVKSSRNGYGKTIQYGAIKYRSAKAFNEAFAKKWKLNPEDTYHTVIQRLQADWDPAKILKTPVRNMDNSLSAAARANGMSYQTLYIRVVKQGMSIEDAIAKGVRFRTPNKSKVVGGTLVETMELPKDETEMSDETETVAEEIETLVEDNQTILETVQS